MNPPSDTATIFENMNPEQRKKIIKAIAAAFRWKAAYNEIYNGDDENMTVLAQLQEQLLDDNLFANA